MMFVSDPDSPAPRIGRLSGVVWTRVFIKPLPCADARLCWLDSRVSVDSGRVHAGFADVLYRFNTVLGCVKSSDLLLSSHVLPWAVPPSFVTLSGSFITRTPGV